MKAANDITALMQLLQMSDSTFPVGTFSFSNGLETAAYEKIVHDADTLKQYVTSVSLQGAYTDGIAAIHAYRAVKSDGLERLKEIDRKLMMCKLNDEARLMLMRMGKKLSELAVKLIPDNSLLEGWLEAINSGEIAGSYPVTQGIVFAVKDLSEEALFASHQYGVINMVLGAALRLVRVSHYDTQLILEEMSVQVPEIYEHVKTLSMNDINCFVPQMDILASLHEKGTMRMFMN